MSLRKRLHNFFYAATHSNELCALKENSTVQNAALSKLKAEIQNQAEVIRQLQKALDDGDANWSLINAYRERKRSPALESDIPVGRIDYLSHRGVVCESVEYYNADHFVSDIMHQNDCGSPMSIVIYTDPETGAHIDTSWRDALDPPPQGFCVAPYQATQETVEEPNRMAPDCVPEM